MYEDDLRQLFRNAKEDAIHYFNSKSLGEVADEYVEDLEMKFDQIFSQYKSENENESRKACQIILQQQYSPIEDRVRNQEFQTFYEFTSVIAEF